MARFCSSSCCRRVAETAVEVGRALGQALAAVDEHPPLLLRRDCRPHVERLDEGTLLQALTQHRIHVGAVERIDPGLRDAQKHPDVRPLERVFDVFGGGVGGLLTELTQNHGRGARQVVDRLELEPEQHGHRNGHDHSE
jgi:hypothetical protein